MTGVEAPESRPTTSGYYTIRVKQYANRDPMLNLRMGLYVNYYNEPVVTRDRRSNLLWY